MKKTTLLFLIFYSTIKLNAQNNCNTALSITEGATTTVGILDGVYDPTCWGADAGLGEWYKYTATITGVINITSDLPQNDGVINSDDTRVSIFIGASCAALTCYSGSDDISDNNYLTDLTFACEAGVTYYILWDDTWNDSGFDFILTETEVNCPDGTLPILEDFSDKNRFAVCWDNIDEDGDFQSWYIVDYDLDNSGEPDGNPCLASNSWNVNALTPNNWSVSYPIDLTSYSTNDIIDLTWIARGLDDLFPEEKYSVYAGNSNLIANLESSPVVFTETLMDGGEGDGDWTPTRTLDLSSLAGQMIYIAFRHWDVTDQFVLNIDDVAINWSLGISDTVFSKIKIVPLDKSIALYNLPESTNYKLYSITGQSILEGKTTQNSYVIEANTIATGVYILEIKDNATNAILKKKIVM